MIIQNKRTGARWRSANPASGVWQKVGASLVGAKSSKQVGYVALYFFPFSRKNSHRFEVLA